MMTTEPLVAITVAIVFIGEIVTVNVLVGGILIITAGILLEKKYNEPKSYSPP
jgi:drug/metabolite transporter (DMT)-like permease